MTSVDQLTGARRSRRREAFAVVLVAVLEAVLEAVLGGAMKWKTATKWLIPRTIIIMATTVTVAMAKTAQASLVRE